MTAAGAGPSATPSFVSGPVTVEVPATTANLGPGFDCLGLALELCDTLVGEVAGPGDIADPGGTGRSGLDVELVGEGAADLPRDERHLVVRSMRAAFEQLGGQPGHLRLHCTNRIPHSRGMGSSSAAIVGGIVLARALVVGGDALLPDPAALELANAIEGHPDNVAPALLGGFVVAGQADGEVWAQHAPVAAGISAVVAVPTEGVATEVARGLLPATVPHADAAANTGRAALLVAAMSTAPERLLRATEDFLHQRQREPAMPATLALVRSLRDRGVPATVSGAGPTVLALATDEASREPLRRLVEELAPAGWTVLAQSVGGPGARVLA